MSNLVRRSLLVFVVSSVYALGIIIWTLPHWWYRIGTAEPGVAVYKSWSGDVLFVVTHDSLQEQYLFYPTTKEIGVAPGGGLYFTPVVVFSNEARVPIVWSSDKIKVETVTNIVVDDYRVEFTCLHGARVRAARNRF